MDGSRGTGADEGIIWPCNCAAKLRDDAVVPIGMGLLSALVAEGITV